MGWRNRFTTFGATPPTRPRECRATARSTQFRFFFFFFVWLLVPFGTLGRLSVVRRCALTKLITYTMSPPPHLTIHPPKSTSFVHQRRQVTAATFELVRGAFGCAPRGPVEIKSKGMLNTFLVTRARTYESGQLESAQLESSGALEAVVCGRCGWFLWMYFFWEWHHGMAALCGVALWWRGN